MSTSTATQAITWLDTFQRSREVEGDVLNLGLGDGSVSTSLADASRPGDRFVIIDPWWMTPGSFRIGPDRDLIIIAEDPVLAMGSEAIELEYGRYRIVAVNGERKGDMMRLLLFMAEALVSKHGLVMVTPAQGADWWYEHYAEVSEWPLRNVGQVGDTLLLCKDPTWRADYASVLISAGDDDVREV